MAFGGLLLLGGRISDFWGRKRAFMAGLLGFAGASAIGGIAQNQEMLFSARALQGVFAALLAPAALSLITTTFSDSKERAKAFGVYGGPRNFAHVNSLSHMYRCIVGTQSVFVGIDHEYPD